jgi:hypothetical protein
LFSNIPSGRGISMSPEEPPPVELFSTMSQRARIRPLMRR